MSPTATGQHNRFYSQQNCFYEVLSKCKKKKKKKKKCRRHELWQMNLSANNITLQRNVV